MMNDIDDFTFYLQFTKPMVLNLPNIKDRAMAALWLEKLSEINEKNPTDNAHVEYLKLLLFALQRHNLRGIFKQHPPEGPLQQHPEMNTAMDMTKLVEKPAKTISSSSFPLIYAEIGGGMREFAAVQEIPNFGLHGYYAISNEPLPLWTHNKSGLLKSNGNIKNISRFKDSRDYEQLRERDLIESALQKVELKTKVIHDTNETNITIKNEEIPENEIRPCWGTGRYYERLIDQSPYVTADLELATADALLHAFRDKKILDKGMNEACVSSMRKRQFEKTFTCSPNAYNSEYDGIQCQNNSEEQLLNLEDGIGSTNCYMKNNANVPRNKCRNKRKNDGAYESSASSKGCLLNPDYHTRL
ncbi:hypothetical protein KPH14_002771 [Odynerus spinipes]|uniref:DUF4485 domain-containing protein n=1 Tax=Odynerus spinipes TaxID=1348599 RepID=A0AAD9RLP9_9HYME|nr:hypothetical protein KPH14_002771 [Odynerus spinipes]